MPDKGKEASSDDTQRLVGRLAPTPSARMHIGNIFASLVAWLSARSVKGRIVFRIEDLDFARCDPAFGDALAKDFEKLGLNWDNSTILRQSQRTGAYQDAFAFLEDRKLIYPCFCSRADWHAASAPHKGDKPVYPGTCAHLTALQQAKKARKRTPSMRLRVPNRTIVFNDMLQGREEQNLSRDCGDFIVKRSDGVFAYQLAVVVDDLYQQVNQVVRGYDLIGSTPQQLYLRELLAPLQPDTGFDQMTFLHVPLLVDRTGRRLSKRDRDVTLDGLLELFGDVEHLIGYLAAQTGMIDHFEPLTAEELLHEFSLDALKKVKCIVWNPTDGVS